MIGAEIRKAIISSGLKLYQVAKEYGVSDTTFSKYLRYDFSEENTKRVFAIIDKLTKAN